MTREWRWATTCGVASVVLAGCGGGSDITVSSMVAANPRYSQTTTISLSGRGLDQGVTVTADSGCVDMAPVGAATDASAQFTCRITAVGKVRVDARDADGSSLARLEFKVPTPRVTMTVAQAERSGSVVIELDPLSAPQTVDNFLAYVNANFYRNVIFHRVVAGFVVQAGGYTAGPTVKPSTRPPIPLEANNGLTNLRGTIAMARTTEPNSATSQFYFNVVDNPDLDYKDDAHPGYAVFGQVVSGLEVIDEIAAVPVQPDPPSGLTHLPVTNVTITAAAQSR